VKLSNNIVTSLGIKVSKANILSSTKGIVIFKKVLVGFLNLKHIRYLYYPSTIKRLYILFMREKLFLSFFS